MINCENSQKEEKIKYKCNSDIIEPKPIYATNYLPYPKNLKYKRALDGNTFKDFNIYLDLYNFNHEAAKYNIYNNIKQILIQGMTKAVETIKALLKVVPIQKNYIFNDEDIIKMSINYWNKTNIGSQPKVEGKGLIDIGIDLYIFVRFGNISELGENTLASAGARFLDNNSRPLIGVVNINRDIDYTIENSLQYFQTTILHEFIHILGFSNSFFQEKLNVYIKNDIYGKERFYLSSPKLLEVAIKYYNCSQIDGVELEEFGGNGTAGSHWEERILLGEIMNGVVYPEEQVLSEFTLAVLEDTRFYEVKYYTGGLMQYGRNKGCDFLNLKCLNNSETKFKNEFFGQSLYNNIDPSCSSGRQSRAYHFISDYTNSGISIPEEYQYFSDQNFGGRASTDYCPVSQEYFKESENRYYVGHCSTKGSGDYGTFINYYDSNGQKIFNKNGDLASITGETYSDHSFCVLSSLFPNNTENSQTYSKTVNAFCYQMYCSEKSLTIQINDDLLVCPRGGGKINAINYNGYLLCPDYYLICSGTVLCNDLFDCIDKNSSIKDNIFIDYIIKTTQDLFDVEEDDFIENAFELANDGKCPLNCTHCKENGTCIKCNNESKIAEIKINTTSKKKICLDNLTGYYLEDSIYYKCKDNCVECNNASDCNNCISGYFLQKNNTCIKEIEKCTKYSDEGNCIKCEIGYKVENNNCVIGVEFCRNIDSIQNKCIQCVYNYRLSNNDGLCYKVIENCKEYNNQNENLCSYCNKDFAFYEEIRDQCFNKSNFIYGYFTKDNGTIYYNCSDKNNSGVEFCKNCYYENSKGVICIECLSEYAILDDETSKCYIRTNYSNNTFYEVNQTHIKTCSKEKDNCIECEKIENNEINCSKCVEGFRASNKSCFPEIDNCLTYSEDGKCQLCNTSFAFIGENRENCYNINSLQEYYSKDNNISYIKCDNITNGGINYCKKCEYDNIAEELECIQCEVGWVLYEQNTQTCYDNNNYIDNKEYYYEDQYHVKNCSIHLANCLECEKSDEKLNCNLCKNTNEFAIVHGETNYCKKKDEISLDENYLNNGEYYSCFYNNIVQNCKNCISQDNCTLCIEEYAFINKEKSECGKIEKLGNHYIKNKTDITVYIKCSELMDNCDTCISEEDCLTCIDNYGVYKNKSECVEISGQKYYQDKDDKLYYSCEESIENCDKCTAKNNCIQCKSQNIRINSDNSKCHSFDEINPEEYYINPNDNNNYIKCSTYVTNCYSCEYDKGCNNCSTGFIMLNGDNKNCYEKIKTDLTGYFTNDNITYYSCRETIYKNNIQCFTLIPSQIIILTFLQIQMVNNRIICYMITHSPLPKNFSIKLKINIFQRRIRNLASGEREIILTTSEDSNGSKNSIISFTCDEIFNNEDNIKVLDLSFNNDNLITNTVTKNNNCTLRFDKNSDLADTKKVKTMIQEGKIPDCSTEQKNNIVNLRIDKVVNCEFNLNSENKVSFSNEKLNIELIEQENNENIITAECDTQTGNIKSIKCTINNNNQEINNDYYFKDEILFESNQYIVLSSDENIFKIFCEKKQAKKRTLTIIIIISVCAAALIIVFITTCIIVFKKDKKGDDNKSNKSDKSDKKYSKRKIHRKNTGSNSKSEKFRRINYNESEE